MPVVIPSPAELAAPASAGLRATWLGHATALVEIEGRRVLFDPVWSDRCSPSSLVGPRRLHPMPLELSALPAVDAVVIDTTGKSVAEVVQEVLAVVDLKSSI